MQSNLPSYKIKLMDITRKGKCKKVLKTDAKAKVIAERKKKKSNKKNNLKKHCHGYCVDNDRVRYTAPAIQNPAARITKEVKKMR